MTQSLDAPARRSRARVAANGAASAARLDGELLSIARKIGHHGVRNFVEYARQRCSVALTDEYARDLLSRGGYPDPRP